MRENQARIMNYVTATPEFINKHKFTGKTLYFITCNEKNEETTQTSLIKNTYINNEKETTLVSYGSIKSFINDKEVTTHCHRFSTAIINNHDMMCIEGDNVYIKRNISNQK